ncbi:MAG: hypothetical protein AB1696_06140 [Planctomycetota bacterium]
MLEYWRNGISAVTPQCESDGAEDLLLVQRHSRCKLFIVTAVAAFVIYNLNFRTITQVDTVPAGYVAWALLHGQGFDLSVYMANPAHLAEYANQVVHRGRGDRWVSKYPPGSAILALPFYGAACLFSRDMPSSRSAMNRLGKQVAAFYCALATAFFLLVVARSFPSAAVPAAVLFGFGTCVWSTASQALWTHGPAVCCICVGLWFLLSEREDTPPRSAFLGGLALGMGILCRPSVAILLLGAGAGLAIARQWKAVAGLCLGAAAPVSGLVLYNLHYTASTMSGGYGKEASMWSTPLWLGLAGLTIAPSRGLFVFTPAAIVSLFGAAELIRRRLNVTDCTRWILLGLGCGAGLTIVVYAKWHCWSGAWCYGPRFLTEIMPVVCLFFAAGYARLPSLLARRLAIVLVGLSVFIHTLGVAADGRFWHSRHYVGKHATDLFRLEDNQIGAYLRYLVEKSQKMISGENGKEDRQPRLNENGVSSP